MNEILDIKVDEYSSDAIKSQFDRFEEIINDWNVIELKSFARDFIHEIKLFKKDTLFPGNGKGPYISRDTYEP